MTTVLRVPVPSAREGSPRLRLLGVGPEGGVLRDLARFAEGEGAEFERVPDTSAALRTLSDDAWTMVLAVLVKGFLVQAFCGNGEEVLAPACSFACYRLSAQAHGRAYREAPNGAGFAYDLDARTTRYAITG